MAGISQKVSREEVLPLLSRSVILQGYQTGRPTEFLVLLRRYVRQARELSDLAGPDSTVRIGGCKDAENLLHVLGYKIREECGQLSMTLVTADPERAFLTIDSGFPLLDLEEALQKNAPFAYPYGGTAVPVFYTENDWMAVASAKSQDAQGLPEKLLYDPELARLYWAVSRNDAETRTALKQHLGLARLLVFAPILDLYGSQISIRSGRVVVPGGRNAEPQWKDLVGASPGAPTQFLPALLRRDRGWLAAYFDALSRAPQTQQEHLLEGARLKRFYSAFRSPGASADAAARLAFRPAPALMVLVTRLQWDTKGDPYIPGNLQVWSAVLRQKSDSKIVHDWGKRSVDWQHPDQLAEAMFALSRLETDSGPLQAYLSLTELDHRRPPERRLAPQTVGLLASKFAEFSNQYLIFSEFPDLTDASITQFLTIAEGLGKLPDHTLRGNAMGAFQASVGLWQILARQGEIEQAQLNTSWQEVIRPFAKLSSSAQLFTAGRTSFEQLLRATTGRPAGSQDEMVDLLAGAHQTTPEGQRMHAEIANRIRAVLADQRLVSLDTLFGLDEGLSDLSRGAKNRETLLSMAAELREFEMPRPIFTGSERTRWAGGTYNNRHTELQMHTDLAKVIKSGSPAQIEEARGQLATFLRDTLVGMNYAYYEPPGSQVLHNNPLVVRSHDFAGDTVIGVERLWQAPHLFGVGSPAGGGAHLIGSLADLPYVLAEAEQDFIAPDNVQALIWQQFVPGLLSNAIVPRWWSVSRGELHAVALYQRAGEELLEASAKNDELRGKVMAILSDRMFPQRSAAIEQMLRSGQTKEVLPQLMPADTFYVAADFLQKSPSEVAAAGDAGRDLEAMSRQSPAEVSLERLARDFGISHPVWAQSYTRELLNARPFPALGGNYSRLMGECWDSGNLYWARLADEMDYSPVMLNRMVPELTRRMVEKIFATELEDWPAVLRALRETGEEFRQEKTKTPLPAVVGVSRK
jgi:hypothetical protein